MDEKQGASTGSDADTLNSSYEQSREWIRHSNPQGVVSHDSGVNVERAEQEFAELNREFSNISYQVQRLSKHASRNSKTEIHGKDVERSASSTDSVEPWDLEAALRGNQAAEVEAGIKSKHIGKLTAAAALVLY
jgi:ABC-type transporter Mla subunit MlaD